MKGTSLIKQPRLRAGRQRWQQHVALVIESADAAPVHCLPDVDGLGVGVDEQLESQCLSLPHGQQLVVRPTHALRHGALLPCQALLFQHCLQLDLPILALLLQSLRRVDPLRLNAKCSI